MEYQVLSQRSHPQRKHYDSSFLPIQRKIVFKLADWATQQRLPLRQPLIPATTATTL